MHAEDGQTGKQFLCSNVKKNVFLIGDSIRQGYCPVTSRMLASRAEVFFPAENCRNTQYVITRLNAWANMFSDSARVDLVLFNCGHWDIAHWLGGPLPLTGPEEYRRNLNIIFDMLSRLFPHAKILFAATTTMNPSGELGVNPRTNGEIAGYNGIMKTVAGERGVPFLDLFAVTADWDSSHYRDYCHFTEKANELLGTAVATALKAYL